MSGRKRASSPTSGQQTRKTPATDKPSTGNTSEDEIGEWEDRYEDEYESEDIVTEEESSDDDDDDEAMAGPGPEGSAVREASDRVGQMDLQQQDEEEEQETLPYLPQLGQGEKTLAEDEELVPDMSSYVLLHHARLAWPCLSFDVLRDVCLLFSCWSDEADSLGTERRLA